jgi:hypothetical protein
MHVNNDLGMLLQNAENLAYKLGIINPENFHYKIMIIIINMK